MRSRRVADRCKPRYLDARMGIASIAINPTGAKVYAYRFVWKLILFHKQLIDGSFRILKVKVPLIQLMALLNKGGHTIPNIPKLPRIWKKEI